MKKIPHLIIENITGEIIGRFRSKKRANETAIDMNKKLAKCKKEAEPDVVNLYKYVFKRKSKESKTHITECAGNVKGRFKAIKDKRFSDQPFTDFSFLLDEEGKVK